MDGNDGFCSSTGGDGGDCGGRWGWRWCWYSAVDGFAYGLGLGPPVTGTLYTRWW